MFKLRSWRWSRLTEPSALKRVITHFNQIFFVMIAVGFCSALFARENPELWKSSGFWCFIAVVTLLAAVATICTADKYFEIKLNDKVHQRIYLYNHGIYFPEAKIDMVIISKIHGEEYIFSEKISQDYTYWENNIFLFCIDDNYYYLSSKLHDPEPLGRKKTKTSFISGTQPVIKALDCNDVLTIQSNCFIFGKVFVPPVAEGQITSSRGTEKLPDNYLITKDGKRYTVYGLYEEEPRVTSLHIPVVIFKEGGQDVVLTYENGKGYREVFRTKMSVKRNLSTVFVELTDNKPGVNGIIRHFNEETMQIETLYEGRFYAIDFDSGAIVGENGFEYNPK